MVDGEIVTPQSENLGFFSLTFKDENLLPPRRTQMFDVPLNHTSVPRCHRRLKREIDPYGSSEKGASEPFEVTPEMTPTVQVELSIVLPLVLMQKGRNMHIKKLIGN